MSEVLIIAKQEHVPNDVLGDARFKGADVETLQWDDLGGARGVFRTIRQASPKKIALQVADLRLFRSPFIHKVLLFLAAPAATRVVLDQFGGVESASFWRLCSIDLARFIGGALLAPFVIAQILWQLWRLDRETEPRPAKLPVKRVAIFRPHFFHIQFGGTLAHLHGVLDGFSGNDIDTVLFATDRPIGISQATEQFHVPPPLVFRDYPEIQELAANATIAAVAERELRANPPDALYQRHQGASLFGVALAKRLHIPLILEFNSSDAAREKLWGEQKSRLGRLKMAVERVSLRRADLVVAVSSVLKQQAIDFASISPERVLVQSNGVNLSRFSPGAGEPDRRRALGLEADDIAVGFLGSLNAYMGLDVLVEAMAELIQRGDATNIKAVIVGEGGERPKLEKRIAEIDGLEQRVLFTGAVDFNEAPATLACFDIAVSPHNPPISDNEFYWSPIKIFEYMAAGKPIVASDVGQIREILVQAHSGQLVSRGDVDALASAILELAGDRDLRQRLGEKARETAERLYSWEAVVANILAASTKNSEHQLQAS